MTHPLKLDLPPGEGGDAPAPAATLPSHLEAAFAASPLGMLLVDRGGMLVAANRALADLLGAPDDALRGVPLLDLAAPDAVEGAQGLRERLAALFEGEVDRVVGEWTPRSEDGTAPWLQLVLAPVLAEDGSEELFFGQVFDVSAERQRRETLQRAARVDPLTGIGNRSAVLERLRRELARSRRAGDGVALIFGDLDNFKLINDSLGHPAGDAVLKLVAERLRGALRQNDLVGRVGGDEFVVVLRGIARSEDPERVARSLLEVVQRDVRIHGHRVVPGISLGVALADAHTTPEDLMRRADMAMYVAKGSGGGRLVLYDEGMQAASTARFRLEEAIREGLDAGQFTTSFQPILSLHEQALFGVEALCRWRHPDGKETPARGFLDVAVESRTIDRIGERVVEDVIAFSRAVDLDGGLVTMNLTAEEIRPGSTLDRIREALDAGRIEPTQLGLELTEASTARLTASCRKRLFHVIARGVPLFLDDFGTGVSSITNLRDLPVRGIKLAPTFVANLDRDADYRLAEGLSRFADRLGVERIAEGVETEAQEAALRRMGWPHVQGFRYGPAEPLAAWLR